MMPDDAKAVREMFESVAPRYDLLNRLCSLGLDRGWRNALVRSLTIAEGSRVLDLASGSGDVARAVLAGSPRCFVVGLDCAGQMLTVARGKSRALHVSCGGSSRLEFVQGWGERLPFADGSFAAVTCAFGVRNFKPMEAVLAEVHRVTQSHGQLRILEFAMPQAKPWRWIYQLYLAGVVPGLGAILSSREAYSYLDHSIREFLSPVEFCRVVSRAGFSAVRSQNLAGGAVVLVKGQKERPAA